MKHSAKSHIHMKILASIATSKPDELPIEADDDRVDESGYGEENK